MGVATHGLYSDQPRASREFRTGRSRRYRAPCRNYRTLVELLEIMRSIPGWDQYYFDICKVVSTRSKDPNTQIGCVIIGPNHEIRSTGYNSFPRGIRDDVAERLV